MGYNTIMQGVDKYGVFMCLIATVKIIIFYN